jgi:hypothetical protein
METPSDRPSYEPEASPAGQQDSGSEAKISSFNRLIHVFFKPAEVFEDITRKPTWVVALLCTALVIFGQTLVISMNKDYEATVRQGVEMFGVELSDEQIDQQVESQQSRWFLGPVIAFVLSPIAFLIAAVVFFLMLKLMGSELNYTGSLSTMLHAYWPAKLVGGALLSFMVWRHGAVTDMGLVKVLKSSLAGFLPESASLPVGVLASFVDVFRIWGIVLLAMGFAIVARVSKGKAWTATLVPWVLFALFSAGLAALPGLFMGN